MKIIILHHLEPCWDYGLKSCGTSFQEFALDILEHLKDSQYDRVILTRFEDTQLDHEHLLLGLGEYVDQVHNYSYGWEKCMVEEGCFHDSQEWVEGGAHSEIVLIEDWMKELRDYEVHLCGAFDGECIEDMEIALAGADVSFVRLNHLIV